MKNSTKGLLFQIPGIIIIVLCAVGSLFLKLNPALNAQYGIKWPTPITIVLFAVLYFIGMYYMRKGDNPSW